MCLHMGASYIGTSVCVYMIRPLVWGVVIVIARPCAIYLLACVCVCVSLLVVEWWVCVRRSPCLYIGWAMREQLLEVYNALP